MDIKNVLGFHKKWLNGENDGIRADLSGADLRNADLSSADLRNANLSGADLSGADLRNADLSSADLRNANLSGADLRNADLSSADLRNADLRNADLSGAKLRRADLINANLSSADLRNADLSSADLINANLSSADLRNADLSGAKLRRADLRNADLSSANLNYADLNYADLSGAKGLLSQSDYIKANFKTTDAGIIVYKTFSEHYSANPNWKLKANQYITENVNPNRTNDCGCGVNVGTAKYIINNTNGEPWECVIEWADLAGVVVPYSTDGKIRAERAKLIRPITREELKGLIE